MNRVFVEKKQGFDLEAREALNEIRNFLKISGVTNVRLLIRYDVDGLTEKQFKQAAAEIYSQSLTEQLYDSDYKPSGRILALESLPGQYDQRSDFATQCTKLVSENEVIVKCGKVFIFEGEISEPQFNTIKSYFINPVESIESTLEMPKTLKVNYAEIETVETIKGFSAFGDKELNEFSKNYGINMGMEDLKFCQDYFIKEKKDPTITELRMFDTYWSDHCRHSTFMTVIDSVEIEDGIYKNAITDALNRYYSTKKEIGSASLPCLMDIAVIGMKKMRKNGLLSDLEVSDEVNACSLYTDVIIDGKPEKWLFMFKNETHNHPTEIEPFGGASTCLGGGIRDPLSGRAYVHGAIRLTGCADPRTSYADTLPGKLSQRKLTRTAAEGYSSYANQIGLASGHLSEIYDDGFAAKRMECGALVAGTRLSDVVRKTPKKGDVIVLVGGNTGRDGCGGATGSSKGHDEASLEKGGAEVQKGNPAIERNIVRVFRNPEASKMIIKCNDFGAGGVSVAVCEMADSLLIDLDKVPLKYGGMDGTEIAISESQERMACMLEAHDLDSFIDICDKENLQCVKIAEVTDTGRIVMTWKGKTIVDLSREIVDSGGVRQHTTVKVEKANPADVKLMPQGLKKGSSIETNWLANMADLNVCSKAAIADRFDTTSAGNTVLMPYGGKTQKTAEQGLCMKFPARLGRCDTATLMSVGYNPKLGYFSPFHQAVYAVLESVLKITAMGGNPEKIRLTFQEYYEKLGNDPAKWGKPFAALLGAFLAQDELNIPSVGGKDSMSGTFKDINVPPSLISFAVATADVNSIVSASFKKTGSRVVRIYADKNDEYLPDWEQFRRNVKTVHSLILNGNIRASSAVTFGGVSAAISNMCFGNGLGFSFAEKLTDEELFTADYTSLILEIDENTDLSGLTYKELGRVTSGAEIEIGGERISLSSVLQASEGTLESVFSSKPLVENEKQDCRADYYDKCKLRYPKQGKVNVLMPLFPGTNGEYELEDAFVKAGASVKALVFRNRDLSQQAKSVAELAEEIRNTDILAIPSGMSAGGEPDGSGKFIASVLRKTEVKKAIEELIERKGLILGLGEGFNALLRTGLLPDGKFGENNTVLLEKNTLNKYKCQLANIRVSSAMSPWMRPFDVGRNFVQPVSIQDGRVVMSEETFKKLCEKGQIAAQYADTQNQPSMDISANPFGSAYAVESMTSADGRILGKTASFERVGSGLYKNIPNIEYCDLAKNAVDYFKKEKLPKVAIVMGSDSDWKTVKPAVDTLEKFGVEYDVNVMSAHRTPLAVAETVKAAYAGGIRVIIAAAGKAAHLAGVVAAYTTIPVIGLPISSSTLDGTDALLAMVQMPPGIPVATVAIDGGQNAALLAIAILANADMRLHGELEAYRRSMEAAVMQKNRQLKNEVELTYGN